LQAGAAPLGVITEKLVPVSAPVPRVPILKIQIPVEGPLRVRTLPVDVAAASKQ
jgi:hypothetical protein